MTYTRRKFLRDGSLAALACQTSGLPAFASGSSGKFVTTMRAKVATAQLAPDGYPQTPIWGYDGTVPGPIIRVPQGENLKLWFVNEIPQPSTIHWHGIRIENPMDGVPDLTQPAVPQGKWFLYDFTVPDAGTFWYHSHVRSFEQMGRGLYGALVVEEPDPPRVDREKVLLLDDWRLSNDATIHDSFESLHDWSHAGRIGNWITVNGDGRWNDAAKRHERLRLRLANVANARELSLSLIGLEGWIIAIDGQPVPALIAADEFELAPGQRVDLIVDVVADVGDDSVLAVHLQDGVDILASFAVDGIARPGRLPEPEPLAPNPVAVLGNLANARQEMVLMSGGAMGGLREAQLNEQVLGPRELAQQGMFWALNGVADMPDTPFATFHRGETVILNVQNETAFPHAMHVHGHHFHTIAPDGAVGPLRDTFVVERNDAVKIAFVADNPGDWLFHCHMLEHSISGMKTWFRVG